MRYRIAVALVLLAGSAPALATGGFDCRAVDQSGVRISGVTGRAIVTPLISARLTEGRRILSTSGNQPPLAIGQSWIDGREIRVDLVDPQAMRFEARLRVMLTPRGQGMGMLARNGRTYRVRCAVE